jgi:hypothetical protein
LEIPLLIMIAFHFLSQLDLWDSWNPN